jgi:cell division protein FtsB
MSTNRSIQAAQRRRAGPPEPQQRRQTPVTSVNTAQMFASQVRGGNGPNIPNGRLAGQQAALAQKEMMKQQLEEKQNGSGLTNINKMTIAQAITLITLRLGKIETSLQNISLGNGDLSQLETFDKELAHSIMERLDNLEKNVHNTELLTIRQNVEKNLVPMITQTRTTLNTLVKENNALKTQVSTLNDELNLTKQLVFELQNSITFEEQEQGQQELGEEQNEEYFEEQDDTTTVDISPLSLKEFVEEELSIEM